MESESVVQPGASIDLRHVTTPAPLEGTLILPGKASAMGGYSTIYKGTWIHGEEKSTVCVKWLRMNPGDKAVQGLTKEQRLERRIKRETIVWGNASHPNIYPYLGYQVVKGETWLISPWTESGSLYIYLQRNPDLDYSAKLKLLKDAAQGLAYLHGQTHPIAHGDLNPGNILIRAIEGVSTAALCDFGLSRVMTEFDGHSGLTTAGAVTGTIGFSAAELLSEETLPTRMSDVYALAGVILFAMSGDRPFHKKKTAAAIILSISRREKPQTADHPGLPENDPLWPLLQQCWSPVPADRPTVEGVIAKLDELIAGN
ncbi:hypothetical protein FRC04_002775 [Tulasnella sp. 424]|nr:hypothetical protein FRC04_002775 [Tulasnella sp. 424]